MAKECVRKLARRLRNPDANNIPDSIMKAWADACNSNSKTAKSALFETWLSAGKDWSLPLDCKILALTHTSYVFCCVARPEADDEADADSCGPRGREEKDGHLGAKRDCVSGSTFQMLRVANPAATATASWRGCYLSRPGDSAKGATRSGSRTPGHSWS